MGSVAPREARRHRLSGSPTGRMDPDGGQDPGRLFPLRLVLLDGPYTRGKSALNARRALVRGMGKTVDEEVVRAFLRVLEDEGFDYASAMDTRFSFPARGCASNALSST